MTRNISKIVLKGIAFAIGMVVIVMSTLETLDNIAGVSMLGMGLARSPIFKTREVPVKTISVKSMVALLLFHGYDGQPWNLHGFVVWGTLVQGGTGWMSHAEKLTRGAAMDVLSLVR